MFSTDESWPRLWEAHSSTFDDDLPFWISLAAQFGGPILELGCGTGRVAFALALHGFDVLGIDNDPAMLRRARARLPADLRSRIQLIEADMRDFTLMQRFGLAVMPLNAFSALARIDALGTLARVHRHLRPGAALALEIPNPDEAFDPDIDESEPIAGFVDPETDRPVQVYARQSLDAAAQRLNVEWCYEELLPDGTARRTIVPATYVLYSQAEITLILTQAGFASVRIYGDYDCGPLRPTSAGMLIVAIA